MIVAAPRSFRWPQLPLAEWWPLLWDCHRQQRRLRGGHYVPVLLRQPHGTYSLARSLTLVVMWCDFSLLTRTHALSLARAELYV